MVSSSEVLEDIMDSIAVTAATMIRRAEGSRARHGGMNFGATIAAISGLMGDVHKMAYVDPYIHLRHEPKIGRDDDLEGRDPSW